MRVNDRARRAVHDDLDADEQVAAILPLNIHLGGSSTDLSSGSSVLGSPYAEARGIDLDDPKLRADLLTIWCTVTGRRLLFHEPKQTSVRPTPGKLVDEVPLEATTLAWYDSSGAGTRHRVVHLTFPDGRHLLSGTLVKAPLRRKTYNDEAELFVRAFGERAAEVPLSLIHI